MKDGATITADGGRAAQAPWIWYQYERGSAEATLKQQSTAYPLTSIYNENARFLSATCTTWDQRNMSSNSFMGNYYELVQGFLGDSAYYYLSSRGIYYYSGETASQTNYGIHIVGKNLITQSTLKICRFLSAEHQQQLTA